MTPLRIGTRGSELALWQATEVARLLAGAGFDSEIVTIRTTGDRRDDVSLASIGGKGLFIKELEDALESGHIDLAAHSLKDVPSLIAPQFELCAFLERADPRDVWIQNEGKSLEALPPGSVIGTSSPRRRAQILALHPGLSTRDIRGNVGTRLDKHDAGDFDGLVLAAAGLSRLGRTDRIHSFFAVDEMVPAAGQGTIAIEIARENGRARDAALAIDSKPSRRAALVERAVLQHFGEQLDCYSPIAVHASIEESGLRVRAFLSDLEGRNPIRADETGADPEELAAHVAGKLIQGGGIELLAASSKR
ncbi:MAG TPA: hydroxymethylbilane synthase [Thermoanaerobaculia bacterium]|nr:hydroxymethylbilane synthase [Thermoanaerobaculia bacterium]